MDSRRAFSAAAGTFTDLIGRVPTSLLDGPGLGEWDLRALIGHASRALITVETYLERPADTLSVASAAGYYAAAAASVTDPAAVTERGRQAGRDLGDDPARAVRALVARVGTKLRDVDAGYQLMTIAGGMRLEDYLRTRTFELAVHSLDIAGAAGLPVCLPHDVLADALALSGEIAAERDDAPATLRALAGRIDLPPGYSVV